MIERTTKHIPDFDRDMVSAAIVEISGYNPYTRYQVLKDGKLAVTVPGGLLSEQRELIKAYRDGLVAYLTTPPDIIGICQRSHRVQWRCTEYGVWVCACYYGALSVKEALQPEEKDTSGPVPIRAKRSNQDQVLEAGVPVASCPKGEESAPAVLPVKKKIDRGTASHAVLYQQEGLCYLYKDSRSVPTELPSCIEHFITIFEEHGIGTLWVLPGCQFSKEVTWEYVGNYDCENYNVFPDRPMAGRERKPTYIRLRRARHEGDAYQQEYYLAFPEYEDWKDSGKTWECPDPQTLLDTVSYIEEEYPHFGWSPQNLGKQLLRSVHEKEHWEIPDTILTDYLKDALTRSVQRPTWIRDGGLTDEQKEMRWLVGADKNGQYVGGTRSLLLGTGQYTRVDKTAFNERIPGLWYAQVMGVRETIFNSYDLFCPWTAPKQWFSTDLLVAARSAGIQFEILEGIIWEEHGKYMDAWGKQVWEHRSAYYDTDRFPNEIARLNAAGTAKQAGNSFIGLVAAPQKVPGKGMIYRPDWNTLIIHKAIANLIYSLKSRYEKHGILPVLLARGDTQWFVSSEPTIPGLFDYAQEQRGWKPIGRPVPMSDEIIEMFQVQEGKGVKANEAKASRIAGYLEQKAKEI